MQDSIKIEDITFKYRDEVVTPEQTYITPFGEVYIAFKTMGNAYVNISAKEVKRLIENPRKHGILVSEVLLHV